MSLRVLNQAGEEIYADLLSPQELEALRGKSTLTHPQCSHQMIPVQKSKTGRTQHFKHKQLGTECEIAHSGESDTHQQLKELIYRAATEAGWKAKVEYRNKNNSHISDVEVWKGNYRIGFEVQLSDQTIAEIQQRTKTRLKNKVDKVIWLVPDTLRFKGFDLEVVKVYPDEEPSNVLCYSPTYQMETKIEITEFVKGLLQGKFQTLNRHPLFDTDKILELEQTTDATQTKLNLLINSPYGGNQKLYAGLFFIITGNISVKRKNNPITNHPAYDATYHKQVWYINVELVNIRTAEILDVYLEIIDSKQPPLKPNSEYGLQGILVNMNQQTPTNRSSFQLFGEAVDLDNRFTGK